MLEAAYKTVSQWVRDLTGEGIEPHPGPNPSFVSKNVKGVSAAREFSRLLRAFVERELGLGPSSE